MGRGLERAATASEAGPAACDLARKVSLCARRPALARVAGRLLVFFQRASPPEPDGEIESRGFSLELDGRPGPPSRAGEAGEAAHRGLGGRHHGRSSPVLPPRSAPGEVIFLFSRLLLRRKGRFRPVSPPGPPASCTYTKPTRAGRAALAGFTTCVCVGRGGFCRFSWSQTLSPLMNNRRLTSARGAPRSGL